MLAYMSGLPLSGKSTYAKLLKEQGFTVICPDEIRLALHGQEFVPEAEDFVWANCKLTVKYLLATDHDVLVDATNINTYERRVWQRLATKLYVPLYAYVTRTSAAECIERAKADNREHMIPVIEKKAKDYDGVLPSEVDRIFYVC